LSFLPDEWGLYRVGACTENTTGILSCS